MASPDNTRISNRKKKLRKTWSSPEWKKAVKEFVKGKTCQWCGSTDKLTAHHPYLNTYSDTTYLDLYLSGCIVLCNRCHFAVHHNLILCPSCRVKYMRVGSDVCFGCYLKRHPDYAEKIALNKERKKQLRKELERNSRTKFRKDKHNSSPGSEHKT